MHVFVLSWAKSGKSGFPHLLDPHALTQSRDQTERLRVDFSHRLVTAGIVELSALREEYAVALVAYFRK
jgi:hypothetical protein